ncbi:MAG TPA: hypothetical protein VGN06_07670 [Gaiellaceae bacterium]|jgi:hypothetical protein
MSSDPAVIERYAAGLNQKAESRVLRFTLLGLLVGGALGATPTIAPLVSHVHSWVPHRFAYAAIVFGLAAGGYLGFLIGQSRAVALRLQASMAVHQVEIGRMLHRAEAMRLPLPAAASLPAPAPAPAPAAAPAPLAAPAPAPVTSLPAPPPVAPAPPPVAPALRPVAPAPVPAAIQPAPVPQLTAVPPVFEWPQPSQDATGTGS